jgi:hypothetical protein
MRRQPSFWDRLLGRKPKLEPTTPEEQMRVALEALRDRQARKLKKGHRERTHVTDHRDLVITKDHTAEMPDALADLTAQAYANRKHTQGDEVTRTELRPTTGEPPSEAAAEAAREIERGTSAEDLEAARQGHYYSQRERRETGEVERTYSIEEAKRRGVDASKRPGKRS